MRPIVVTASTSQTTSNLVRFDEWAFPQISIQCSVSTAGLNYTVQQSLDDPNDPTNPVPLANMTWINHPDTNLVSATTSVQSNYAYCPRDARVVLNSGIGTVTATFIQSNAVTL